MQESDNFKDVSRLLGALRHMGGSKKTTKEKMFDFNIGVAPKKNFLQKKKKGFAHPGIPEKRHRE